MTYHPECYGCSRRDDTCKESEWNEKAEPCTEFVLKEPNPLVPPGFPEDMIASIPDLLS